MRIVSKILIAITALALVGFVSVYALNSTITSPEALSSSLERAGVYTQGSVAMRSVINSSLADAKLDPKAVGYVVDSSVSADSVRQAAKPALQDITTMLGSSSFVAREIAFDMSSIKSQMIREAKLQGSYDAAFVMSRDMSDRLVLVKADEPDKTASLYVNYKSVSNSASWLGLAVLGGLILMIVLAFGKSYKRLAWPGWTFLIAGVIGLSLDYGVPFVLNATLLAPTAKGSGEYNGVVSGLVGALLETPNIYYYTLITVGLGLLATSMVMHKKHDKKEKKR